MSNGLNLPFDIDSFPPRTINRHQTHSLFSLSHDDRIPRRPLGLAHRVMTVLFFQRHLTLTYLALGHHVDFMTRDHHSHLTTVYVGAELQSRSFTRAQLVFDRRARRSVDPARVRAGRDTTSTTLTSLDRARRAPWRRRGMSLHHVLSPGAPSFVPPHDYKARAQRSRRQLPPFSDVHIDAWACPDASLLPPLCPGSLPIHLDSMRRCGGTSAVALCRRRAFYPVVMPLASCVGADLEATRALSCVGEAAGVVYRRSRCTPSIIATLPVARRMRELPQAAYVMGEGYSGLERGCRCAYVRQIHHPSPPDSREGDLLGKPPEACALSLAFSEFEPLERPFLGEIEPPEARAGFLGEGCDEDQDYDQVSASTAGRPLNRLSGGDEPPEACGDFPTAFDEGVPPEARACPSAKGAKGIGIPPPHAARCGGASTRFKPLFGGREPAERCASAAGFFANPPTAGGMRGLPRQFHWRGRIAGGARGGTSVKEARRVGILPPPHEKIDFFRAFAIEGMKGGRRERRDFILCAPALAVFCETWSTPLSFPYLGYGRGEEVEYSEERFRADLGGSAYVSSQGWYRTASLLCGTASSFRRGTGPSLLRAARAISRGSPLILAVARRGEFRWNNDALDPIVPPRFDLKGEGVDARLRVCGKGLAIAFSPARVRMNVDSTRLHLFILLAKLIDV
ncbi:uncharacterized protein SCHCODRAFT_0232277 [Schizophyllum commune H4-8]|uniref:Uncharacterized protein n=1 Tax=Schizophyllum commune (strain H4-8 / FGSC 9210) TaxID=578458 RepID=D8PVI2_SCHCM|nr:uncharacterized protein SCHCODRAFT_0232277 [Schizophyllum commune H4-8]KAI5900342.1 hypothetical protein SCHCODRAFT_0232277 [Schizophyllum commune H4-8]